MDLKVNTSEGWTEAIIDDDCEFAKFYRVADILTADFNLQYNQELEHDGISYKNFDFNGSKLSLHYTINTGISIFPIALKASTALDNARVLEIGQLLFDKVIDLDWEPFENGMESLNGARITLEKHSDVSFAITLGIYGLMMHTHFESESDKAKEYVRLAMFKINNIFDLYDTEKEQRSEYWEEKRKKMINELAEMQYTERSTPGVLIPPGTVKPVKIWWKRLLSKR
jgi:hypothetical protein